MPLRAMRDLVIYLFLRITPPQQLSRRALSLRLCATSAARAAGGFDFDVIPNTFRRAAAS
jgi:hypothetical protein